MNPENKKAAGESTTSRERKAGLSCAECRRSKLKCDRVFPCQSCTRRGCAAICPDGTLAATKGNKVLIAHAERLSQKVTTLTERIQELEAALAQNKSGDETHPLLQKYLSDEDVTKEWDPSLQDVSEAIGSLSIGLDGQAKYHGETAGSEYLHELLAPDDDDWRERDPKYLGLPAEMSNLVNAFPFGLRDCPYTKYLFLSYLPSKERALELAELYYKYVAWMYDPIVKGDFMSTIITPIYGSSDLINLDSIHSHRLSVFFILLANGVLHDPNPSSSVMADQYHALSRAALSLDPILQEVTCATVQALFMIFRFIYNSDRSNNEERWLLCGLCARVAQSIGLQRDSAGWNLDADEIQRRRTMFWELYTYDAWTSVVNGRPPALAIQHTDCRFPDDLDPSIRPSGETELGWHAWKFRYSAACLSISVQHVFSARTPSYRALLDLDRRIRKHPLPVHLQCPMQASEAGRSWSPDPSRAMQQYCVVCERESNLLYVHRGYFAQAIRKAPDDPLKHEYAPSVLATYRSACRLISSLRGLYQVHPQITSTCWFFWSGIFSSCIVLGALVVESAGCTLAQDALTELEHAVPFYEHGSTPCRPSATLTVLQKLVRRARIAFNEHHSGMSTDRPPVGGDPNAPDELEVLGGRKIVIQSRTSSNSPGSTQEGSYRASSEDSGFGSIPGSGDSWETPVDYYQELGNPTCYALSDSEMAGTLAIPAAAVCNRQHTAVTGYYAPTIDHSGSLGLMPSAHPPAVYASSAMLMGAVPSQSPVPGPMATTQNYQSTQALQLPQVRLYQIPPEHHYSCQYGARDQNQHEIWSKFMKEFGLDK